MSTTDTDASGGVSGRYEVTRRLLDAAVDVFAENGFEAARVAEIARRAGLTTGAIYARWLGKRDLLHAAIDHAAIDHAMPRGQLAEIATPDMSGAEVLSVLAKALIVTERTASRDVTLEAFVSARRDEAFRKVVSQSLGAGAEGLAAIVSKGKTDESIDGCLSTASIVTFCQALGLGMSLVVSTESEGRFSPTTDEWNAFIDRLSEALTPRDCEHSGSSHD